MPAIRATLAVAALLFLCSGCSRKSDLPLLYPVPAASLTTDGGKPFRLDALKGYVTVYDFIFTNCAGTCPLMSQSMHNLTHDIAPSLPVRFVSISVDPDRDSPEALRKYGARLGRDARWMFLTGDKKTIVNLSERGFRLAAIGSGDQPGSEAILHSSKFALVDRKGVIRGYYDGTSPEGVAKLTDDVRDLVREQ